MNQIDLDEVDRGILQLLQEDARNYTAAAIADEVGVVPNTVRNRIERLEDAGVIEGYHPQINYERAGYQLHVIFVCTVPILKRKELADDALDIDGVIEVTEILSGHENLAVEVVGTDSDDLAAIAEQLEELEIKIHDEWFVKRAHPQPFNHFGSKPIDE